MKNFTYLLLACFCSLLGTTALSMEKELEQKESHFHSFTELPVELQQCIVSLSTNNPSLKKTLLNFYPMSLVCKNWKSLLENKNIIANIFANTTSLALQEELGIPDFESPYAYELLHNSLKNKLIAAFVTDDLLVKYTIMRVLSMSNYTQPHANKISQLLVEKSEPEIDEIYKTIQYLLQFKILVKNWTEKFPDRKQEIIDKTFAPLTKLMLCFAHGNDPYQHIAALNTMDADTFTLRFLCESFQSIESLYKNQNYKCKELYWTCCCKTYMPAVFYKKKYFEKLTVKKHAMNQPNVITDIPNSVNLLSSICALVDTFFQDLLEQKLPTNTVVENFTKIMEITSAGRTDNLFHFNNMQLIELFLDLGLAYAIAYDHTDLMQFILSERAQQIWFYLFATQAAINKKNTPILKQILSTYSFPFDSELTKTIVFLCITGGKEIFNILLDNVSETEKQTLKTYYETGKLPQKTLLEKMNSFLTLTRKKPADSLEFTILVAIAVIKNDFETIQYYAKTTPLFQNNIGMLIMLACKYKNIKMLRLLQEIIVQVPRDW